MTDFYIFRHGDTVRTGSIVIKFFGYIRDSHHIKILPKAVPALERVGKFLKDIHTDINFRSPYLRCDESTKIVGTISGKKYLVDDRIRELEHNGESFSSFKGRVNSFLSEIQEKNYSAVSICTHGAVMAAIKHLTTTGSFHFYQVFDYPPPGQMIIIKNRKLSQINFNSI